MFFKYKIFIRSYNVNFCIRNEWTFVKNLCDLISFSLKKSPQHEIPIFLKKLHPKSYIGWLKHYDFLEASTSFADCFEHSWTLWFAFFMTLPTCSLSYINKCEHWCSHKSAKAHRRSLLRFLFQYLCIECFSSIIC